MESKVLDDFSLKTILDLEMKFLSSLQLGSTGYQRDLAVLPYDSSKVFRYAERYCGGGNDCPDDMFPLDCTHFLSHCLLASGVKLLDPPVKCRTGLCIRVNELAAAFANAVDRYTNIKKISRHADTSRGDFCFIPGWFGLRKEHVMLLADTATATGARVFAHTNERCGALVSFEGESCVYYRIENA